MTLHVLTMVRKVTYNSLLKSLVDLFSLANHLRLILAASFSKMRSSSVDHPVKVGLVVGGLPPNSQPFALELEVDVGGPM